MIYRCYKCRGMSFFESCKKCGVETDDVQIPLDPSFYPEFQYKSKGLIKDLFGKKKEVANLEKKLSNVLEKYNELKTPFFTNFVHISNQHTEETDLMARQRGVRIGGDYSQIEIFQEVLVFNGFDELNEIPVLLDKLLMTTMFASEYAGFSREFARHLKDNVDDSLRSWVSESGLAFRKDLAMALYFLWSSDCFETELNWNEQAASVRGQKLISDQELLKWRKRSETIYYELCVRRMDTRLKHFSSERFVTIHSVDAMDGYQFEDFLLNLFQTIGYDVQGTKRTGDQGADLFVEKFGKKTVIQAKNYTKSVGNSAVQEALSAKAFYGCDAAMVVTNSYYTPSAIELAKAASVKLVGRDELDDYLDEYNQRLIEQEEDRGEVEVC